MKYLTVFLLGLAMLLSGCSSDHQPAAAGAAAAVSVKTVKLERSAIADTFEAPGTVRARNTATIASKVPGYIQEIRVKPGDRVRAGQTLVVLQAQDLEAQVAGARAGSLAAQNAVLEAEKARAAAESNAELASNTFRRYQTLLEKRSVSPQEFEEVEARYKAAAAARDMSSAAIARARAAQEQADAGVRVARVMQSYSVLAAPFAGLVAEKRVDPGTLAMPGQPLLTIEQAGDFRLEATVEESRVGAIRLGDSVRVSIEALGADVDGRVSEIAPSMEAASRSFVVKIDLPAGTMPALHGGLFGRAIFRHGERQALAVPESAVRRYGQLQSVFVIENGVARQRLITLGEKFGDRLEVLSGLEGGERLVLNPSPGLQDGARVNEAAQSAEVRP